MFLNVNKLINHLNISFLFLLLINLSWSDNLFNVIPRLAYPLVESLFSYRYKTTENVFPIELSKLKLNTSNTEIQALTKNTLLLDFSTLLFTNKPLITTTLLKKRSLFQKWTYFNNKFHPNTNIVPTTPKYNDLHTNYASCECKKSKTHIHNFNSNNYLPVYNENFTSPLIDEKNSTNSNSDLIEASSTITRTLTTNRVNLRKSNSITPRIINGQKVQYHRFPYIVSLGIAIKKKYTNASHYCGGTLITHEWILTAAHCLKDYLPKKLLIALGSGDRLNMKYILEHQTIVVHPNYTGWPNYENDLALLKLKQPIPANTLIKPTCLPPNNVRFNKEFLALGWGTLQFGGGFSSHLQRATFNYVDYNDCVKTWSKEVDHPPISHKHICVYNSVSDICNGDSGSPLINKAEDGINYLVGVASFTNFCNKTQPAVYARVSSYLPWIVSIVKYFC